MVASPDGSRAYVTNENDGFVTLVIPFDTGRFEPSDWARPEK